MSKLLALHQNVSELRDKYTNMTGNVEQRLKWAAGSNPTIAKVGAFLRLCSHFVQFPYVCETYSPALQKLFLFILYIVIAIFHKCGAQCIRSKFPYFSSIFICCHKLSSSVHPFHSFFFLASRHTPKNHIFHLLGIENIITYYKYNIGYTVLT